MTVEVYGSCGAPTSTTTLDFPSSFSFAENTTSVAPAPETQYVTYTTVSDGSTVYITSTLHPVILPPQEVTSTSVRDGSTIYVTSTLPPQYVTLTSVRDGSMVMLPRPSLRPLPLKLSGLVRNMSPTPRSEMDRRFLSLQHYPRSPSLKLQARLPSQQRPGLQPWSPSSRLLLYNLPLLSW